MESINQKTFSVKHIEQDLQRLINTSKEYNQSLSNKDITSMYEQVTGLIKANYENVICKRVDQSTLVHLQFGVPLGQQVQRQCQLIHQNYNRLNPESKTIVLDMYTGKAVSNFEHFLPILPFDKNQRQLVIDEIVKLPTKTNKANLTAYWMPYGMTFQCIYNNDKWIMLTQSLSRINEATFGGQHTLEQIFEKMLSNYGIGFKSLNTNLLYSFHVAIQNFSLIPIVEDQLYIYDIQIPCTGKQVLKDSLWNIIPSLNPVNVYIPDNKQAGLVNNRIFGKNGEFERLRYEFKLPVPMQSLLIIIGGKTYEILTSVKELVINFNVYRKQSNKSIDLPDQLKTYMVSQLNGKNQYINYIQQHLSFIEQTPIATPIQTIYNQTKTKYLGTMTPEQLVQLPEWRSNKCGQMLYEFLYNMYTQTKLPVFIASAVDEKQSIGMIVGMLLSLPDDLLSNIVFNESQILQYTYQSRMLKTQTYYKSEFPEADDQTIQEKVSEFYQQMNKVI